MAFRRLVCEAPLTPLNPKAAVIVLTGAGRIGAGVGRGLRNLDCPELVYRVSTVALVVMATAMSVQTPRMA